MAGEELQSALGGLAFSGMDNPYGIAASALGTATPGMISPYASTGQALGIGLGSILLQSLLGYQARQTALQDTLQANTLANQMLKLQTPEERVSFISGLDESPQIATKLSALSTALQQQELARKLKTSTILDELRTKGEFETSPLGTELYQRELNKQAAIQGAVTERVLEAERLRQAGKPNTENKEIQSLRREFNMRPEVKNFSKMRDAASTVQLAEKDPSAVASMELAKRAIHLIEPGLAALQGEVAAVENSASIPGAFKAKLKKALIGEGGLDENVRKGIIEMAKRAYGVASQSYDETRKFYEDEALAAGLDPKRISSFGIAKTFEQLNLPTGDANLNTSVDVAKLKRFEELKAQLAELKARRGAK